MHIVAEDAHRFCCTEILAKICIVAGEQQVVCSPQRLVCRKGFALKDIKSSSSDLFVV